jgi:hypothetical protein
VSDLHEAPSMRLRVAGLGDADLLHGLAL